MTPDHPAQDDDAARRGQKSAESEIITTALDDLPVRIGTVDLEINQETLPDGSWAISLSAGTKKYGTLAVPKEDRDKIAQGLQP